MGTHGYKDIYTRDNGRSTAGLAGRYYANPGNHTKTTDLKKTGISLNEEQTGISLIGEKTGISLNKENTGISLSDTTIGVSVEGVNEESIKDDHETRPTNMH